jgi:hypothetical protein
MSLSFLYWFLVLVYILFGGYLGFRPNGDRWYFGASLLTLLLLIVIGLKLFGFPIQGG